MPTLQDVFNRYYELRNYCDAFWNRVHTAFPDQFACEAGCSTCCTLTSVCRLEAAVITEYRRIAAGKSALQPAGGDSCAFLAEERCSIYPARPIICRTHGLLLRNAHFSEPVLPSCPFNFAATDFRAIDAALALDSEKVSMNLARLNTEFCLLSEKTSDSSIRIPLPRLAADTDI